MEPMTMLPARLKTCVEGCGPSTQPRSPHEPHMRAKSRTKSARIGCRALCTAQHMDAWLRALVPWCHPAAGLRGPLKGGIW